MPTFHSTVMPEGEKMWGASSNRGIICPPPVGIGLTDLPNIGGPVASLPPASLKYQYIHHSFLVYYFAQAINEKTIPARFAFFIWYLFFRGKIKYQVCKIPYENSILRNFDIEGCDLSAGQVARNPRAQILQVWFKTDMDS